MGILSTKIEWVCDFCPRTEITDSKNNVPGSWVRKNSLGKFESEKKLLSFNFSALPQELACGKCYQAIELEVERILLDGFLSFEKLLASRKEVLPKNDRTQVAEALQNYIKHVNLWSERTAIGTILCPHSESFLVSIEDAIPIPADRRSDYRKELLNFIKALASEDKKFTVATNHKLTAAIETVLAKK